MTWPEAIVTLVIGLAVIEGFLGPIQEIIAAFKGKQEEKK